MGADAGLLSPVFPPGSKPDDLRIPHGLEGLAACCAASPLPVIALGGIASSSVASCWRCGAAGVAGIGAFFSGDDPRAATIKMMAAWASSISKSASHHVSTREA